MARKTALERFLSQGARPAKLGTVPMLVRVHPTDEKRLAVGEFIRVQEALNAKWERVLVTRLDPDNYFMADRM